MQVKLKPVQVFNVIGSAGTLHRMMQIGDEWNGMIELQDASGNKLVLMRENGPMVQAMSELMKGESEWTVIVGAPSLLHELVNTPAESNTGNPGSMF